MSEREVIVIGAGLSGLASAIYARLNGYPCLILERNSGPGGLATCWRRGDYLFCGGLRSVLGHRPEDSTSFLFQELGVELEGRVADVYVYGRFLDENKGRRVDVTRDLVRLARDLKGYAGEDLAVVDRLIDGARKLKGRDMGRLNLSLAPELSDPLSRIMDGWTVRRAGKSFTGVYGRSISEFASACTDPWLRNLLLNLFVPDAPVWFACFLLALFSDGGLGYFKDGGEGFIKALEKRFVELGGKVTYNSPVEKILVEGGRARGVRLEDGSLLRCGAVLSAVDGRDTLLRLLGENHVDRASVRRITEGKLSPAGLTVSFGLSREFPQDVPLTVISLMHPFAINGGKVETLLLRIFNYSPAFAPRGKTVVQAWVEADFDFWQGLRDKDRSRYETEKNRVADEILKRLEKHYPGLSGQVEVRDVASPATVWRYTRNHRGASAAWMPTPRFFRTPLRRTVGGLSDFYLAGQWVAGSGVVSCAHSGRQAVQLLCRSDRKPFRI